MKKISVIFSLCILVSLNALDPGGIAYDLSDSGYQTASVQRPNLLKDGSFEEFAVASPKKGWSTSQNIHVPKHDRPPEGFREEFKRLAKSFRSADNPHSGSYCAVLATPLEIQQLRTAEGAPMISNRLNQLINVPELTQPAKYRLSMFLRGKTESLPGVSGFRTFVTFADKERKATRKTINQLMPVVGQWEYRQVEFVVPEKTSRMAVALALYGAGEVYIDEVKLEHIEINEGITARLMPYAFWGREFALGQGVAASLSFAFNNEAGSKDQVVKLGVKLPPGFSILASGLPTPIIKKWQDAEGYLYCLLDLQKIAKSFGKDFYSMVQVATLLVKSDREPSDTRYLAEYWVESADYRSKTENFNFVIIPSFEGRMPKIFCSAAVISRDFQYNGPEVKDIVKLYQAAGFNALHGNLPKNLSQAMKKAGIERYFQPYFLCNGYRIGMPGKPPEALFRLVDGSPWLKPHEKICPVEVYRQGEYYRTQVIGMLEKILVIDDIADQIMPNWEPYYLDFKGCFCERCKQEFIKYAVDIPGADIEKKWPAEIIASYRETWIKFRSWQHGRLTSQLEQSINEIGKKAGKDSHFIPEIAWTKLTEDRGSAFAQYDVLDYINDLPWIEPWGPYISHGLTGKYIYYPGVHLLTWVAGAEMKEFVAAHARKMPGLIAFPHSYQGNDRVTEPEALAFEFLCYLFNGWEGAFAYTFPHGYDHRYFKALADSNNIISEYEEYVYHGNKITSEVELVPQTPLPKPFYIANYFAKRGIEHKSMLQYQAFRHGDKILVAAGNFWQKGEVFFLLKLKYLDSASSYMVKMDNKYLGDFTGKELTEGILAHAGALCWAVITIEPTADKLMTGERLTQEKVRKLMRERSETISRMAEWEEKYRRQFGSELAAAEPVNDFSKFREIKAGTVSLKHISEKQHDYLEAITPRYRVLIDPVNGGRLLEWQAGDILLSGNVGQLGFAVDAFWWPKKAARQITSGYKFVEAKADKEVINVVLERTLSDRDNPILAGLHLTKTYRFYPDGIDIMIEISNQSKKKLAFSYRSHNLPAMLVPRGRAAFGDGTEFRREFLEKMYRFAEEDKDLDGIFRMNKLLKTTSAQVVFSIPGSALKLQADLAQECLHGVVFWDSGKQEHATFEPVFKKVQLESGQKISYRIDWTLL